MSFTAIPVFSTITKALHHPAALPVSLVLNSLQIPLIFFTLILLILRSYKIFSDESDKSVSKINTSVIAPTKWIQLYWRQNTIVQGIVLCCLVFYSAHVLHLYALFLE